MTNAHEPDQNTWWFIRPSLSAMGTAIRTKQYRNCFDLARVTAELALRTATRPFYLRFVAVKNPQREQTDCREDQAP